MLNVAMNLLSLVGLLQTNGDWDFSGGFTFRTLRHTGVTATRATKVARGLAGGGTSPPVTGLTGGAAQPLARVTHASTAHGLFARVRLGGVAADAERGESVGGETHEPCAYTCTCARTDAHALCSMHCVPQWQVQELSEGSGSSPFSARPPLNPPTRGPVPLSAISAGAPAAAGQPGQGNASPFAIELRWLLSSEQRRESERSRSSGDSSPEPGRRPSRRMSA